MNKLIKVAPALGRLGWTIIAFVFLFVLLAVCLFCLFVILTTSPEPLLYPLGAFA
jgi:lipopolysaccharide/colanic/teichoic acid biosynthesis glycosyltransferase